MERPLPRDRARIAVLIPSYNAEETLPRALASLAANAEAHDVVIVDDGSRRPLASCLTPPPNTSILRLEPNRGIVGALNHGLERIIEQGYDYVARLDADDVAAPDRLARQRAFLDREQDVVAVGGWGRIVSELGETLYFVNHPNDFAQIRRALFYNNAFFHPTLMMRASALHAVGGYIDAYPGAEDYELVRRLAAVGTLANLPEYLIDYTASPGGISLSKRRRQLLSRLGVQWAYRDLRNPHCYLGAAATLALLAVPNRVVTTLKQVSPLHRRR